MMRYFFLFLMVFSVSCSRKSISANEKLYSCENVSNTDNFECKVLQVLSDSILFDKYFIDTNRTKAINKSQCLHNIIAELFRKAKLNPNWICSFELCTYNNFSFEKSIYTIDILRLMRFYKCPDSSRLQFRTKVNFSVADLRLIERRNQFPGENNIDTMILYGK